MEQIESWRMVWRDGFVPLFTLAELEALRDAIKSDDPRLVQGQTTDPPPLLCVADWPVRCGCLVAYPGAAVNGGFSAVTAGDVPVDNPNACTVGKAEELFAKRCFDADQLLGEPGACRYLLNWFDDTPRTHVLRELLPEVERAITLKGVDTDAYSDGAD